MTRDDESLQPNLTKVYSSLLDGYRMKVVALEKRYDAPSRSHRLPVKRMLSALEMNYVMNAPLDAPWAEGRRRW